MPGYDSTGPDGKGPMTGGGWGPCGSRNRLGSGARVGVGMGGRPRGGGAGRCWGGGRSRWLDGRRATENIASPVDTDVKQLESSVQDLLDEVVELKKQILVLEGNGTTARAKE